MTSFVFIALAVAGGLGAALRLLVDGLIRNRFTVAYPLGTTVINISGALLLGIITGATLGHLLAPEWQLILGTGLMGGYTTFSTASFETVRLLQDRRYVPAFANGLGMLVVSVAAAALGLWIGGKL
jgi:CrcB protein